MPGTARSQPDPKDQPAGLGLAAANRLLAEYTQHVAARLPARWRQAEEQRMRQEPPRIDPPGIYQLTGPAGQIAFEYDVDAGRLLCSAKIHKIRREYPLVGLTVDELRAGLDHAVAAGVDTGGGELVWDPEAQGFFLRRAYSRPPKTMRQMARDLDRLTDVGEKWFRKHYLEAVLAQAERMRPPESATGRQEDLRLTIVLTPDKRYQDLWRRPPGAVQPQLVTRAEFRRGEEVWALALFSGAAADGDGLVRLQAQYSFVYPNGEEHGSPVGNLWAAEAPPRDHLQMSEFRAALELDADKLPGRYLVRIKACDPSLQRCLTAETPFVLRP
jgi:hypothetical protein